jgi:hypothetical protein
MAYRASDDGSGFWAGKSRMARELEMNQRTVKFCIKDLLATGLISAVGKRPCSGGHTIIYQLNLKAILALEPANAAIDDKFEESRGLSSQGVNDVHPPSETDSPKGVHDVPPPVKQIHPRWCMTSPPPSETDSPKVVHDVHPNHPSTIQEPSVARATSDLEFEDFQNAHPRPKDPEKTRRLFDKVVLSGTTAADLIKAANIFREQQKGQTHRFITGSDKWLDSRGYEDALRSTVSVRSSDEQFSSKVTQNYADAFRKGHGNLARNCTPALVKQLVESGQITSEQCRAVEVSIEGPSP